MTEPSDRQDVREGDVVREHPAVDFVNTLGGSEDAVHETLHDYADLVGWTEHAGLVEPAYAGALRESARRDPPRAAAVLDAARRLRAHLDAVLRAIVTGGDPPPESLDVLRDAYAEAIRNARLRPAPQAYDWSWSGGAGVDPRGVLWPVARQAADLLRSAELDRLDICGACRWLFIDRSKNRSRRWCAHCGPRERMRRYRTRRRT